MRAPINLDDDVLVAARGIARRNGASFGAVVSDLARSGLDANPDDDAKDRNANFYGFRPLPKRGQAVTNQLIGRLGDEGPY